MFTRKSLPTAAFVARTMKKAAAAASASHKLLRSFATDRSGNVIVTAGLVLPVVVGIGGAAVAYSMGISSKAKLQAAVDHAVLAGAAAGGSATNQSDAARLFFSQNIGSFVKATMLASANGTFESDGVIVTGTAGGNMTNPFGGMIGTKTIAVSVSAAATTQKVPICVLGLNGLDNGSFDINGQPQFNSSCAVQANSTSSTGMTQEGPAVVKAAKFSVSGGHKTTNYVPPPTDGAAKTADPYASMPFPFTADCSGGGNNGIDIKDDTTLSPGTYCGGIHVFSGANVKLQPGVYVMSGGPLWTDGGANVTGTNVMIAFTGKGSTLNVWGNSTVNVTSPTSGTYANMQFFQDPSDANSRGLWASIGGGNSSTAKLTFDGVAYFPTQNFWMYGSSVINANSPTMAIVADKIWAQGNATVNITNANPRNLSVPAAPTTAGGVVLIR